MAHCIILKRSDGGISIANSIEPTIAAMTGSGGLMGHNVNDPISAPHLAYIEAHAATNAAAKVILDRQGERALIELDYEIAKSVAVDGISESIVRPYCEAKANGGVTEEQAISYIAAYDAVVVAQSMDLEILSTHLAQDTDLPTDRYFRKAWEWSD
jgi:hypothetical protein